MNDSNQNEISMAGNTKTTSSNNLFNTDSAKTKSNSIQIPTINLPKGGGAIKGIDEKFSVNTMNGTSSLNIPIPVSEARGFSPSLSLNYNSGSGNGIFGLGWSLSIPSIKRKTDKELPQYSDDIESDTFIISDAEDLVPEFKKGPDGKFIQKPDQSYELNEYSRKGTDYTVNHYRPRIEGLFSKIERWKNLITGEIHWRTISKDNITSIYGKSKDAKLSDPKDDNKIYEWFLEFSYNDKGSCIYYKYKPENKDKLDETKSFNKNKFNQEKIFYANTYLKSVLYGIKKAYYQDDYSPFEFPKDEDQYFFNTILDYGEHNEAKPTSFEESLWNFRHDAFSDYRAGFEIRTCRLCERILHFHNFDELSSLVKSVDLSYFSNNNLGFTFLKEIVNKGYIKRSDGSYSSKSFPPLTFEYQEFKWNTEVESISPENLKDAPAGIDGANFHFADLFSEGLSGILSEHSSGWFYKSNLGSGNFTPAKLISPKPSFEGLQQKLVLTDLESNGVKQFVQWDTEPKGFFELDPDENWQPFKPFREVPNINQKDNTVRLLDLDGDGLSDILVTEDEVFTWYRSKGKEGYCASRKVLKESDEENGPSVIFSDDIQTIFLADMNGDGLTDIVRIRNGEVCYWPNLGYCKFGTKILFENSPIFDTAEAFNPSFLRLADIDGSGTSDIIYLGKNEFSIYLNSNGNEFYDKKIIEPFPEINNQVRIDVADLLGTGLSCIIWNSTLQKHSNSPLRYIDLMKSKKPHIMSSYKNNMGKEIKMEYTPSTKYYIEDKLAGKPWITKLHFPVHCISKLITEEKITGSKFVISYKYHHGFYDHEEKEFRGFGMVEQTDSEHYEHWIKGTASKIVDDSLHQKPVKTKSWIHTGAFLSGKGYLKLYSRDYWYNEMISRGFPVSEEEYDLPDARLVAGIGLDPSYSFTIEEKREALRACKGMSLRTELFALDAPLAGAAPEDIKKELTPYSVSSKNCFVELLQPKGQNKHAIFIVKESESLTYNYERIIEDPRTAHTLNIKLDEYGNILESASVVYPRKITDNSLPDETRIAQSRMLITYTHNTFTNDVLKEDINIQRLPSESKNYELKGVSKANDFFLISDFIDILSNSSEVNYSQFFQEPLPGQSQKRNIEHTLNLYYDDDLKNSLPPGTLKFRALLYENYQLAYTTELVGDIFDTRVSDQMLDEGKFIKIENKWWVRSGTLQYLYDNEAPEKSKVRFFQPISYKDPYGALTKITYAYEYLLLKETEDAKQNKISVEKFNLRTLNPGKIKDENNNLSEVYFDELGIVKTMALYGKGKDAGSTEADDLTGMTELTEKAEIDLIHEFFNIPDLPNGVADSDKLIEKANQLLQHSTIRYVYELDNFRINGKPVVVSSIQREVHYKENKNSKIQLSFEYSNGMGEVAMKKVQAEPGLAKRVIVHPDNTFTIDEVDTTPYLRWVGTGRTVLNNKGNAVMQYEPYFSITYKYENLKELVESGVTPLLYYDALNRLIKTEIPDGTFSKVEFDSWYIKSYDGNDTVKESEWYIKKISGTAEEKDAASKAMMHYNTPSIDYLDTLGRKICNIADNGSYDFSTDTKTELFYLSIIFLDIEGNQRKLKDARDNIVMEYKYDMLGNLAYQKSMDAGERWMFNDCIQKPLYKWDGKKSEFKFSYDEIHRPVKIEVTESGKSSIVSFIIEYGESILLENMRGKIYRTYDSAGIITNEEYDFKGNLLKSKRQLCKEYKQVIDWTKISDVTLMADDYNTTTKYDALDRPVEMISPDNSVFIPSYNEASLLENVKVKIRSTKDHEFVKNIDYNEKGQRTQIEYGNNIITTYKYDEKNFRIKQILTNRNNSDIFQDLHYTYDPVGNITKIKDESQDDIYFNNSVVVANGDFTYDAIYRLIKAEGRENIGRNLAIDEYDIFRKFSGLKGDGNAMQNYRQFYEYDKAGNMIKMKHSAGKGVFTNRWTRNFEYETNSNRLKTTQIGSELPLSYGFDIHGNITSMPHLESLNWNFNDQLSSIVKATSNTEVDFNTAYYIYDGSGNRIRKVITHGNGITEERIYIGMVEYYTKKNSTSTSIKRETLHVMDDKKRIAMVDTKTIENDVEIEESLIRYRLDNHLGTACVEIDDKAELISYEEYYPFGSTAYQVTRNDIEVPVKRYRYTGKERDEESGLYYHGARYYAPWLARWTAVDPIDVGDGWNVYLFVNNCPINLVDRSGTEGEWWNTSVSELWNTSVQGNKDAQAWVHETAGQIGELIVDLGAAAIEKGSIKNETLKSAILSRSVLLASEVSTALEVAGGIVMIGPNTVVAVSEVPDQITLGWFDIRQGNYLLGSLEIVEGLGTIAGAALLATGAIKAVQTRSAIKAARAPALPGNTVELEMKPNTGKTPGITYIRTEKIPNFKVSAEFGSSKGWQAPEMKVKLSTGSAMKTTTTISKEGTVISSHTDLRGKYGGHRARIFKFETKSASIGPSFPDKFIGIKDIPGPSAPHYTLTTTPFLFSIKEQSELEK